MSSDLSDHTPQSTVRKRYGHDKQLHVHRPSTVLLRFRKEAKCVCKQRPRKFENNRRGLGVCLQTRAGQALLIVAGRRSEDEDSWPHRDALLPVCRPVTSLPFTPCMRRSGNAAPPEASTSIYRFFLAVINIT